MKKVVWFLAAFGFLVLVLGVFFWPTISSRLWGGELNYVFLPSQEITTTALVYNALENTKENSFFTDTKDALITQKTNFIVADLTNKLIEVYQAGEVIMSFPILSSGKEGSWWETPVGLYKILNKERDHFSTIGKVWMPYSLNFQGNFFIHGETYYPDGTPTSAAFTGGCIRLADVDAEKLFAWTKIGTPVLVTEQSFVNDDFVYQSNSQNRYQAKSYLIGDLKNDNILQYKDTQQKLPIASITKLMTALIALEYINIDNQTEVASSTIAFFTSQPRLEPGQKYSIYQLLFPLLLESSNEAAIAIADYMGPELLVQRMNTKAKAIGMINTTFKDSSGIDAGNISTAEDLFLLAKYIYHNRHFVFDISSGNYKNIVKIYGAPGWEGLNNFNYFIDQLGFVGGKNGQTSAAKETNLAVFEKEVDGVERPIVFIMLGADKVQAESQRMINWFDEKYGAVK